MRDPDRFVAVSVYKGMAFVLVTALLLFLLMRRLLGALANREARERQRSEALLSGQNRILEEIVRGASRRAALDSIVLFIEAQSPGMLCSVLLLDDDRVTLRHGAGPSLPAEYIAAVDGSSIGPLAGSCGTAAFTGQPVYVEDIDSDPRWAAYKHLALPHGLRACWSTPIHDAAGAVAGTFAMYYTRPALPSRDQRDLIAVATQLAAIVIARDETERQLRESQGRFDAFMDAAPAIAWVTDEEGRHLYMNKAWGVAFDRDRESFYGRTAADLVPPEVAERIRASDRRVLEDGTPLHVPEDRTAYGNAVHWWNTVKFPFTNAHGQRFIGGVAIDITPRKAMERQLTLLRERLEVVVENLREGLLISDSETGTVHWNPAALRMIGYEDLEQGRRDQERFSELYELSTMDFRVMERRDWPLARVRRGETLLNFDVRVRRRADDWERIFSYSGASVTLAGDDTLAFVTIVDVTGARRKDRELRELAATLEARVAERTTELHEAMLRAEAADRIKSAFLATMSHELRTPLNSIIGFTGILSQGLAGPVNPEQSRQLEMVRTSARHLLALINDVLDISKIEAGQLAVSAEPFALRPLVEQLAASLHPQVERKGLTLTLDLDAAPERLDTDRRRVEQVLLNLLSNAIKFTERGQITVSAVAEPTYRRAPGLRPEPAVRIIVRDTGVGIAERDLAALFQPFRQVDSGLSRQHDGTGLGLSICRRLCDLMGGDIRVTSEYGVGSSFTVILPVNLAPPAV